MSTKQEREHNVQQMLANQRLEGMEPDQAHQQLLQEYIDGTATLNDLYEHAHAYADKLWFQEIMTEVQKLSPEEIQAGSEKYRADEAAKEAYSKLTEEQRKMLDAIDYGVTDSALEGFVIDPVKVEEWKAHVRNGASREDLFEIMRAEKNKFIALPPPIEIIDRPGWKHMGRGYYIVSDPEE